MRFLVTPSPAGAYLDAHQHRFDLHVLPPAARAAGPGVHEADTEPALAAALGLTRQPVSAPPAAPWAWPALTFFLRFTEAERHAIYAAARSSPQLQDFVTLGSASGEIRSDSPLLRSAMLALVQSGLLTQSRADHITGPGTANP